MTNSLGCVEWWSELSWVLPLGLLTHCYLSTAGSPYPRETTPGWSQEVYHQANSAKLAGPVDNVGISMVTCPGPVISGEPGQHCGWWWHGNTNHQSISSHSIDLVFQEYPNFSTKSVDFLIITLSNFRPLPYWFPQLVYQVRIWAEMEVNEFCIWYEWHNCLLPELV